jgi:hypothetical protein
VFILSLGSSILIFVVNYKLWQYTKIGTLRLSILRYHNILPVGLSRTEVIASPPFTVSLLKY